jgi:DNA-binding winged helix-turn-helix (wHTH) protein/Tfp pilus assembly protein PilF
MRTYEFGPFQLDVEQLLLSHHGEPVPLGPKVVETLLALIEYPGEVLAKSALLERIWPEGYVEEANLAQNVYVLRKTLRRLAGIDAIETVPRRGYRFTASVKAVDRAATVPVATSPRSKRRRPAIALGIGFAMLCSALFAALAVAHRAPVQGAGLSADGARVYEIGRYYWNLRSRQGVERSLDYFAQVVRSDPRDARGYAALADANATMGDYRYGPLTPRIYFERASRYARRALDLDPQSAEAHAALGLIDLDKNSVGSSITQFQRAISLDASYGSAHEWYGIALIEQGNLREAFSELQIAGNLDPLSVSTSAWLGSAAYLDHRFSDAIAYSRQALDLAPQRTDLLATIGEAYEAQGNFSQAIDAFHQYESSCANCRAEASALLAHAYAIEHRLPLARAELAFAMQHASSVDPEDLAAAAAAAGDRSIAIGLLRHLRGRLFWIAIENDPRFDALRNDATFRQLAQTPA